jgi:hypothetical protein
MKRPADLDDLERLGHELTARHGNDDLLDCRLAMLGLDRYVIQSGDSEMLESIRRRCARSAAVAKPVWWT